MAIASLGATLITPRLGFSSTTGPSFTTTTLVIDAANEAAAFITRITKAGDITKFSFRLSTVTTGATVDVRAETVDATTGFPTGTLWATNTNASLVIADTDDNTVKEVTFTAAVTVAVGDVIAFVVVNPGASFGNMQFSLLSSWGELSSTTYAALYTGTWASVNLNSPAIGLEYSGSFYFHPHLFPVSSAPVAAAYNSGTNPNHRGMRFRFGAPVQVNGFWAFIDLDGDADVILAADNWDGNVANSLGYRSFDKDIRPTTGVRSVSAFITPVTLSANTTYRLIVKPTSATSLSIYTFTVSAAAKWGQMEAGLEFYYTTANSPTGSGDWTDTTTTRPIMGLFIDGVDDGAGGGGGLLTNPGMGGGMRG